MAIAADLDESPDDLRPRLIAGAALGAMLALLTYGRRGTSADAQAQVAVAIAYLAAGMAASGAASPPPAGAASGPYHDPGRPDDGQYRRHTAPYHGGAAC